jgi:hypothetical protein
VGGIKVSCENVADVWLMVQRPEYEMLLVGVEWYDLWLVVMVVGVMSVFGVEEELLLVSRESCQW